jgi:heavy metal translocating P-type ATPase
VSSAEKSTVHAGTRFLLSRDALLLAATTTGLTVGGAAHIVGVPGVAGWTWRATTLVGMVPALVHLAVGVRHRRPGVDVVAVLAMAGALALGEALAGAVLAMMLATGNGLDAFAAARAQRELHALLSRAPRTAHRRGGGVLHDCAIEEVQPDDVLLVRPGEVVPVDGVVVSDAAVVDESALTGEAVPVSRVRGERVSSGSVNAGAPFDLRATATAEQSTYAGIVRLVAQAQAVRAPMTRLADRWALGFVPLTLSVAGIAWLVSGDAVRALAVLVVATPCPLLLGVPVALISGMSRAARRGMVIKGGATLEALARARVVLLDKTGTLTAGRSRLVEVQAPSGLGRDEVLRLAASLDQVSAHVLAAAVVRAARDRNLALANPSEVAETPGQGVRGMVDGRAVAVGRAAWVVADMPAWLHRVRRRTALEGLTGVAVAVDGTVVGLLVLADQVRGDAPRAVRMFHGLGVHRVVMVTGDHPEVATVIGEAVGVDAVLAERSPSDKVDAVLAERRGSAPGGTVVMVGDGINDAPALAAADVGVALAARGATASSEAADVVILPDRLDRVVECLAIARRTRRIALQSVLGGMGLSLLAMGIAAAGLLAPAPGAVLQEVIDALAIAAALRALGGRSPLPTPSPQAVELAGRVRLEHADLAAGIDRLRDVADALDGTDGARARAGLDEVRRFLQQRLLPHEIDEERHLYPLVGAMLGGSEPTVTMVRAHSEIARLARLLDRAIDDLDVDGPSAEDLPELRRLLYGLHVVLRLHMAQEDEAYLSLLDTEALTPVAPAGGAPHPA